MEPPNPEARRSLHKFLAASANGLLLQPEPDVREPGSAAPAGYLAWSPERPTRLIGQPRRMSFNPLFPPSRFETIIINHCATLRLDKFNSPLGHEHYERKNAFGDASATPLVAIHRAGFDIAPARLHCFGGDHCLNGTACWARSRAVFNPLSSPPLLRGATTKSTWRLPHFEQTSRLRQTSRSRSEPLARGLLAGVEIGDTPAVGAPDTQQ